MQSKYEPCKHEDYGIASPHAWQKLYLMVREETIDAMLEQGICNPEKGDNGFEGHYMDFLKTLILIQPASQETTLSTPIRSPLKDLSHWMSKADERLPATTGIGRLIKSQVNPPVSGHKGPIYSQSTENIKPSSTNIQIPPEARPPPELSTIMEDLNIASALRDLLLLGNLGKEPRYMNNTKQP